MFDSFKQIKQLRELQNAISKEETTIEKDGVSITINGTFEIKDVVINMELSKEKIEKLIKDCQNDAVKKMQSIVAQKFASMQS